MEDESPGVASRCEFCSVHLLKCRGVVKAKGMESAGPLGEANLENDRGPPIEPSSKCGWCWRIHEIHFGI